MAGVTLQLHPREGFLGTFSGFLLTCGPQPERHVFLESEPGEEALAVILEDNCHGLWDVADLVAADRDPARIRMVEAGQAPQERGLAAARGAEDDDKFSGTGA